MNIEVSDYNSFNLGMWDNSSFTILLFLLIFAATRAGGFSSTSARDSGLLEEIQCTKETKGEYFLCLKIILLLILVVYVNKAGKVFGDDEEWMLYG